jgi:hypothetical protein
LWGELVRIVIFVFRLLFVADVDFGEALASFCQLAGNVNVFGRGYVGGVWALRG